MLTEQNFSSFVSATWHKLVADTRSNIKLSEVREQIAHVVVGAGSNTLLKIARTNGGIPLDSSLCASISRHFSVDAVASLPPSLAHWPLPEKFSLTPVERSEMWVEACKLALSQDRINPSIHASFATLEPYIVPAGQGNWTLCNGSPVPMPVCKAVLGPAVVTLQSSNNSLRDDLSQQRHPREAVFYAGLRALRDKDYPAAVSYFKSAAGQQHGHAHFNLAWLLEQGLGIPRSECAAIEHYQAAADLGSVLAHFNLGLMYIVGSLAVTRDIEKARHHFGVAAERGIVPAIAQLGDILYTYSTAPEEKQRGLDMLIRSAREGDAHAQNVLGTILETEARTPEEFTAAFQCYLEAHRQAQEIGDLQATFNLARCYLHGQGTQQDVPEAARLFGMAAAADDMDAAFNLAYIYFNGMMGEPDYAKAYAWAKIAAVRNHPASVNMLGCLYLNGFGVAVDADHAAQLFSKADALDVVDAKFNLAILYANGLGVARDDHRANQLLHEAAARGHIKSKELIAQEFREVL